MNNTDKNNDPKATGTSGRRSGRLPRTASELPLMALFALGAFAAAGFVRAARKAVD